MAKLQVKNYFEELTEKQKLEIEQKKSIGLYYNFFDECEENGLSDAQIGIITQALLKYGKSKGRQPISEELKAKIEADPLICYMCNIWMNRIAEEDKKWLTHKRAKKETKFLDVYGNTFKLKGNAKNMPETVDDIELSDEDIIDFIDYANGVDWCLPYNELLVIWLKNRLSGN